MSGQKVIIVNQACRVDGCPNDVGWSEARGRFAQRCDDHLVLHRRRCKESALKKKQLVADLVHKASAHDALLHQYAHLEAKYRALRKSKVVSK